MEQVPHSLLHPHAEKFMTAIEKQRRWDLSNILAKSGAFEYYES
jgi:hypothetical protein